MHKTIYKIEDAAVWALAQDAGAYTGSPLDMADGYIHLSTFDQVRQTARKWFSGRHGLVLIGVASEFLGEALRYEASRGGALFPHLYAPLSIDAVISVVDLPLDDQGLHIFGPEIA
jgi:uncharacterized protein (DUF952 family)